MALIDLTLNELGVKVVIVAPVVVFAILLRWLYKLIIDPLRDIPGPFFARFTTLWMVRHFIKGDFEQINVALHAQYGPIVRIAPNQYSIDDVAAAKIIYGHGTAFLKSDWYKPWGHADPKLLNLFNDLNPTTHSALRRKVAATYSMSSMVSYEPYVDECTTVFAERLSQFTESGLPIDMGHWFQCYAFDMIGKITFSKRFGFLDAGEDIKGIMKQLEIGALYSSVIGVWASWHQFIFKVMTSLGPDDAGMAFIDKYTRDLIEERNKVKLDTDGPTDFVTKFLRGRQESADQMTEIAIQVSTGANVAAGSDTTSITLSAILYYLCRYPLTMEKLRRELEDNAKAGNISDPITFLEAQKLPYLQAVIKEGLRIHPATGFTMPRIVPKGGQTIVGHHFPEGVTVGINAWVAHQNKEVFGEDADVFEPERWLGRRKKPQQEAYFFTFGQGSRTCIGKNISLLEISKGIPQLVRHFEFEVVNESHWTCLNHWFVNPKDFKCVVRRVAA